VKSSPFLAQAFFSGSAGWQGVFVSGRSIRRGVILDAPAIAA